MKEPDGARDTLPARVASAQLVGRGAQLTAAGAALERAQDGDPSLVLVTGEAGIGKTRLATEVQRRAADGGFTVMRGESVDTGGELAYAPLASAFRHSDHDAIRDAADELSEMTRRDIGSVLPWLQLDPAPAAAAPGATGQASLFGSLAELLGALAAQSPVLLVIEDLHWADRSTLDFLSYLARNVRGERLALLATVRAEALEPALLRDDGPVPAQYLRRLVAELARLDRVHRIDVEALEHAEVAELVGGILGRRAPRDIVESIGRRASGNPFHVEELVAAAMDDSPHPVPRDVREAVLVRVEDLSSRARQVLRAAAGLARPAEQSLLGEIAGLDEVELGAGLRESVAAHLLRREPDEAFAYRHALAREAVYAELLPDERRALHARIAAALVRQPSVAIAELAGHWHAAGDDAPALTASFDAGVEADAVFASAEALLHYSRALELWDRAPDAAADLPLGRIGVIARAAEAAFLAAEHDRCIELWRDALGRVDAAQEPERAAELHQRLGRSQPWNVEASLACYAEALSLLPETPTARRASVLADLAFGLTFQEQWDRARDYAEQALELATAIGAQPEEVSARSTLGVSLAFLGQCDEGERELRAALELARKIDAPKALARVLLDLAEIQRLTGRFADALATMRDGEQVAARRGMDESLGAFMTANAAEDQFRLGAWDGAASSLRALAGRELGPPAMLTRESVAGRLATARGDFAAAEIHFARAIEVSEEVRAIEFAPAIRAGLAELALWQGRPDEARQHVADGLETMGDALDALHAPVLFSVGARATADAAERAQASSRRGRAEERDSDVSALLSQLDAIIERHLAVGGAPEALAHRSLVVAELARLRGETAAAEAWSEAAAQWETLAAPYPVAYARWREAEALLNASGGRPAALTALRAALAAAESVQAVPLLDEIAGLAQRARLDLTAPADERPARRVPAAAEEWGLTERELEVLELLARGLTDKQIGEHLFISSRTAQVHVSRIRMKLDAETRTAAAGIARRLGLIES